MDHAFKVLSGMIGSNGVSLPRLLLNKLEFLQQYGFEFGGWVTNIDNGGGKTLAPWFIVGFVLILAFKNSSEILNGFKFNIRTALFAGVAFVVAILSLSEITEFLYFNF